VPYQRPRLSASARRFGLGAVLAVLVVVLVVPTGPLLPALLPHPPAALSPVASPAAVAIGAAAQRSGASPAVEPTPSTGASPWTDISANLTNHPSAREGAVSVFDPASGAVLLFGGLARNRSLADTWEFKAGHWTNMTPGLTLSPPPRYKGGIVYDAFDGYVLLFGGNAGTSYRNDTWAWNGTAWHRLIAPIAPSPREDFSLVYDAYDQYVLFFGGEQNDQSFVGDTWTFSGGHWSDISASVVGTPPPREAGGATYDRGDQYVVLFSGKSSDSSMLDDTWTYRSGVWTNLTGTLTIAPPGRESMSFAEDFVDGFVLLFGGFHYPNSLADEWMFTGGNWTELFPTTAPSPRLDSGLAYFPNGAFGFVLLFGGRSNPLANGTLLSDTWTYKVPINLYVTATSPIDLGEGASISLRATGGYAPLTFSWQGLPPGCTGGNVSAIACTPLAAGAYPIVASAQDLGGFNDSSNPFVLQINPDPAATASGSPLSGLPPLDVAFTSNVTDGTPPYTYAWNFGDGNVSNVSAPTHTYFPGTFTATLDVTDARSFHAFAAVGPVNVSGPSVALTITATATPSSGGVPLVVNFTSAPAGGVAPYRFAWSFGVVGANAATQNATYTYHAAGSFVARVTVTDLIGEQASASTLVTVNAPPALTAFAGATPANGIVPFLVAFSGSASGGVAPYQFAWDFGVGGATSSGQNPTFVYDVAGPYTATLTVTDAVGGHATSTVDIVASPALSASFSATAGAPYCSGGSGLSVVSVDATAAGGAGGYTYAWTFPAGVAAPPSIPQTTLIVGAGTPIVITLAVNDTAGGSVTVQHNVTAASISCSSSAGSGTAPANWLVWILIAIVAAVIAIELMLLLRRREK